MQQLTGKADIYVNGVWQSTSQEGATLDGMAGVENTIVMNSKGKSGGYTSKAVPCTIKAQFLHGPSFNIAALQGGGGLLASLISSVGRGTMSVVFACDNGPTYQIADAVFLKAESLDANKGLIAISYGGDCAPLASSIMNTVSSGLGSL